MAGNGCQTHAGILTEGEGKLTEKAKTSFIKAVKAELTYGTANLPVPLLFPCGDPVPPNPHADLLDLEDEQKFPEFHKHILGSYEQIAQMLDLPSDFKFLPICCPVSLAFKLGVNIDLEFPGEFVPFLSPLLPLLALKMNVMPPPKLALKFPSIPSLPPALPLPPLPPKFDVKFLPELANFTVSFALGIPKLLASIALKIPELALKIVVLPELFKTICKLAFDSQLFGDIKPSSITQVVAVKVLTTRVVEMMLIAAVGSTLGSSPGGITGGIARFLDFKPPPSPPPTLVDPPRTAMLKFLKSVDGLNWSSDNDRFAQTFMYAEWGDGTPYDGSITKSKLQGGKHAAIEKARQASSCGLLARASWFNGGATDDYFVGLYDPRTALTKLIELAKKKNAVIVHGPASVPQLKPGDAILVASGELMLDAKVLMVTSPYSNGTAGPIECIEGGSDDAGNPGYFNAIKASSYDLIANISGSLSMGSSADAPDPVKVVVIIDGEKMVKKLGT